MEIFCFLYWKESGKIKGKKDIIWLKLCIIYIVRYSVYIGYFRSLVSEIVEVGWDGSKELDGDGKMKNGSIVWCEIGREEFGVE